MLDVTVKTLDGQNKTFSIPEETTVAQFKEKIADSINIPADIQRLIFHGRVLQDDKLLNEYDVDGKVVHVVQRPPPMSMSTSTTESSTSQSAHHHHHHHVHHMPPNVQSFVVGSFTIPPNILNSAPQVDGGSLNVHINLSSLDGASNTANAPSSASATSSAADTSTAQQQGQQAFGASQGGRGLGNTAVEAAQRLAQAKRNFALAENAIARLQNPRNRAAEQTAAMDTGTSTETTVQGASATDSQPSGTSTDPVNPSQSTPQSQSSGSSFTAPREATPQDLASVLRQAERLHQSLSPFIRQLCQLADSDPVVQQQDLRSRQMLVDQVSEALHALSHGYHNISDIAYELAAPPPRQLMAQSLPIYHQAHSPAVVVNQTLHGQPHAASQPPSSQSASAQNNNASITQSSTTSAASHPQPAPEPTAPHPHPHLHTHSSSHSASHSSSHSSSASATASSTDGVGASMSGGAGSEADPYVFVEVGPDSLTVNSISTTVVVSEEVDEDMDFVNLRQGVDSTPSATNTSTSPAATAASTSQSTSTTTTSQSSMMQPPVNFQGFSSIPGVPGELMNSIVQSVLQAHGVRQGDQVQVNVVPVQMPGGGPGMLGVQTNGTGPTNPSGVPVGNSTAQRVGHSTSSTNTGSSSQSSTAAAPTTAGASATTASAAPVPTTAAGPRMSRTQPLSSDAPAFVPRAPGANNNGGPGSVFARIPIFRQRTPMFPPPRGMLPMPLMQPTDIYLPCFSHHFISQAVRERLDQRMQGMPAPQHLGNMMAGMMSTLFGQPRPRGPPVSERSSQQPGGTPQRNANDTTSRAETSTTATQQGSISANPFATLFSQILGGAGPLGQMAAATAGSTANTPSGGGEGASNAPAGGAEGMSDAVFARLVQGVRSQAAQVMTGNQSGQTVAAFLQTLGDNHSIVPGEGFLTDAFLCVAEQLTFADMISIFMGQHQPIARLRRPMRQFVSERVLNGSGITDDNMQRATDQVVEEMLPDIRAIVSGAAVLSDVHLEATLRKFFSHHLMALFKLTVDFNVNDEQFALQFYNDFRRMLGEFVVLMPACLRDGQQAFTTMIQNRLTGMLTGLNPVLQQWMATMTLQHVTSFQQTLAVTPQQVEGYIVRLSATLPTTASMATPVPLGGGGSRESGEVGTAESDTVPSESRASPMEVDSPPPASRGAAAMASSNSVQAPRTLDLTRQSERGDARSRTQEVRVVNGTQHSADSPPATAVTSPSSRQENWQDVVPADWVPVMEADVQRQKTQRPQGPFSDAYLQGMPPKRRRLMSYEQAGNLSNMSDYLPSAVKQAAGRAGVEPISSSDNLVAEAMDAQELQGMLEAELTRSLSDRLEHDDDYSAERFPNAHRYFKPKPS